MKPLDAKSEPVIQLMLDAYDAIATVQAANRAAKFRQVCRKVIAAVAQTGRVSHDDCEAWLSAIGRHAHVPDADRIVRREIVGHGHADQLLH